LCHHELELFVNGEFDRKRKGVQYGLKKW